MRWASVCALKLILCAPTAYYTVVPLLSIVLVGLGLVQNPLIKLHI